jgi:hypothetical protein
MSHYSDCNLKTSHKIQCKTDEGNVDLHLRGIVYHGGHHFTSHIISQGNIWYHDGMTTGQACDKDGTLKSTRDKKLRSCNEKKLVLAVYAQD